jgi:hypothetical protein
MALGAHVGGKDTGVLAGSEELGGEEPERTGGKWFLADVKEAFLEPIVEIVLENGSRKEGDRRG